MSLRAIASTVLAASLAASFAAFAGCGSDAGGAPAGGADASTDAIASDTGAVDASGGNDGGLPDGTVLPTGTQIVPTTGTFKLNGVTSDDFVIYTDVGASTVYAIPVAGGAPAKIESVDAQDTVIVQGKVVFVMATVNQNSNTGPVTVWTSAGGAHPLATSAFAFDAFLRASADGSHVVFLDDIDANDTAGNVYVAASDGTGKTKIVSGAAFSSACFPHVGFAGTYAVASFCVLPPVLDGGAGDASAPDGGDAGAPAAAAYIQSFTQDTGAMKLDANVAPGARFVTHDATKRILAQATDGLDVFSADLSESVVVLDAEGAQGVFTADGASVVYVTTKKILKRTTVASPAPTTLQAVSAALVGLSPDEGAALTFHTQDPQTGNFDLFLQSATASTQAVTLASTAVANVFGDAFTADSSRALFYTNIDTDIGAGNLDFVPVSGGAPVAIGSSVWIDVALGGAKVLFDDNDTSQISGDLEYLDLAAGVTPTKLVSQIDQDFYVTHAKDKVVYGWSLVSGPNSGIWVLPLP